jgi:hypothetical protein
MGAIDLFADPTSPMLQPVESDFELSDGSRVGQASKPPQVGIDIVAQILPLLGLQPGMLGAPLGFAHPTEFGSAGGAERGGGGNPACHAIRKHRDPSDCCQERGAESKPHGEA